MVRSAIRTDPPRSHPTGMESGPGFREPVPEFEGLMDQSGPSTVREPHVEGEGCGAVVENTREIGVFERSLTWVVSGVEVSPLTANIRVRA